MYDLNVQHRFHLQAVYTLPNHIRENIEIFCVLVMPTVFQQVDKELYLN